MTRMHWLVMTFSVALCTGLLSAASAQRPMVAYFQFEGMRGTATEAGVEDWIRAVDFRLETLRASSGGGRVASSRGTSLVITKTVDENTGRIADMCSRTRPVGRAQLMFARVNRGAVQGPYTLCEIREATMSRHILRFDREMGTVLEELHLTISGVRWEYSTSKPRSMGTTASTAVPRGAPKPAKRDR